MMHRRWNILLLIIQCFIPSLCQSGYITVVAPGSIKPNRKYSVFVSLLDAAAPATVRLALGPQSPTNQQLEEIVVLTPMKPRLVHFQAPNPLDGYMYELNAESIEGFNFEKSIELTIMDLDWPRIYVECDRETYKPEDLVQFRVVILDEHVRPLAITEPIDVEILDTQNNRLKKYTNIELNQGVFAADFQLSRQTVIGTWKITVTIGGKYNMKTDQTFVVENEEPSNFRVNIVTSSAYVLRDGTLNAVINGIYTYGMNVHGIVSATLSLNDKELSSKRAELDSNKQIAHFQFTIGSLEEVNDYSVLKLTANLTDKINNQTASAEKEINIRSQHFQIVIPETDVEKLNGTHYRVKAHVRNWDNSIVNERGTFVEKRTSSKSEIRSLEEDGTATFILTKAEVNDDNVKFVYKDSIKEDGISFNSHFSSTDDEDMDNCRLHVRVASPINSRSEIIIDVSADHIIPYLVYTITSHANIVHAQLIPLNAGTKKYRMKIEATIELIPEPVVYVHYVLDGHLRSCEATMKLPEKFENSISIDYRRSSVTGLKPGEEITLNIMTQRNSHVSILAVNSKYPPHGLDNGLHRTKVMDELRRDQTYSYAGYDYHPGIKSGLITLTNANMTIKFGEFENEARRGPTGGFPPRTDFPETWIFRDIYVTEENTALTLRVPDTITTWRLTAFSINERTGLATMLEPLEIEVFQPFFISLNLPNSVKLGETIITPVTIFNYHRESLLTAVAMRSPNRDFHFMDDRRRSLDKLQRQAVLLSVPSNDAKTVYFMINPRKVGEIHIECIAKNRRTRDAVLQKLHVESQDIIKEFNEGRFVVLQKDQEAYKTSFKVDIPTKAVPNFEYISLSASGDVLLPVHLNNFARTPAANGEENMENLALNILVLDYLKVFTKFSNYTQIKDQATKNAELGYQQQLIYRHDNGGYSTHAVNLMDSPVKDDETPSTWLTAQAVRFFIKAEKYDLVEKKILESGLKYLSSQKLPDGRFSNRGNVYNAPYLNEYALTAFVLLTFLENRVYASKYNTVIVQGLSFLNKNIQNINDVYALALAANVLLKKKHNSAIDVVRKLTSRAREQNGRKWWTGSDETIPTASDVEITSYVLMAMLETSAAPADHLPIFSWLIEQRDSRGSFQTNLDSVIGMQAIIKYLEKINFSHDAKFEIHYEAKDIKGITLKKDTMQVDLDNVENLQKQELPSGTRSVDIAIKGHGNAFLNFAHYYGIPNDQKISHQYYLIKPEAKMISSDKMSMRVCYTYQPETTADPQTTNAIMKVHVPSGFVVNLAKADMFENAVAEVEGTGLRIYIKDLKANKEVCYTLQGDKRHDVPVQYDSYIEMYTSNYPKRRALTSYRL